MLEATATLIIHLTRYHMPLLRRWCHRAAAKTGMASIFVVQFQIINLTHQQSGLSPLSATCSGLWRIFIKDSRSLLSRQHPVVWFTKANDLSQSVTGCAPHSRSESKLLMGFQCWSSVSFPFLERALFFGGVKGRNVSLSPSNLNFRRILHQRKLKFNQ